MAFLKHRILFFTSSWSSPEGFNSFLLVMITFSFIGLFGNMRLRRLAFYQDFWLQHIFPHIQPPLPFPVHHPRYGRTLCRRRKAIDLQIIYRALFGYLKTSYSFLKFAPRNRFTRSYTLELIFPVCRKNSKTFNISCRDNGE